MAISEYDKREARRVKKRRLENRIKRLEGRKSTTRRDLRIQKQKNKLAGVNKMILGSKEIDSPTVVSTSQQKIISEINDPNRQAFSSQGKAIYYKPLTDDFRIGNLNETERKKKA